MSKFTGKVPVTRVIKISDMHRDNGKWDFPEKMGVGVGFVYCIFDTILKRGYIGIKSYLGAGVKNKGQDTGWRTYSSSSPVVKKIMGERPKEEFEFICLEQYKTKGTLKYAETWTLCFVEAPTSVIWYNTRIEKISWPVKEPISDRHKERLKSIMERMC
jgi:hypothetical protein